MQALTLYEVEDNLRALIESAAMLEPDTPLAEELFQEIEKTNSAGREKRDNWARFILSLKRAAEAQRREGHRLLDKARSLDNLRERAAERLVVIIEQFAPEPAGKIRSKRLIGDVHMLCAESNAVESTIIEEPEKVPDEYKVVTITMPLDQAVKLGLEYDHKDVELHSTKIRQAILAGSDVPGVRLERRKHLKIR